MSCKIILSLNFTVSGLSALLQQDSCGASVGRENVMDIHGNGNWSEVSSFVSCSVLKDISVTEWRTEGGNGEQWMSAETEAVCSEKQNRQSEVG